MRLNGASRYCVFGLILSAHVGCASGGGLPKAYPMTIKDWNDGTIDRAEFLKGFQLHNYTKLVIPPIDSSKTKLPDKDDNTYEPVKTVIARSDSILTSTLVSALKGHLAVESIKAALGAESAQKTLLLRVKADQIRPGSRALRFWVGFGAGSSGVGLSGELVDATSGDVLVRFRHLRASSLGAYGGDYVRMLSDDLESVGEDIGKLILAFAPPPNA